MAYLKRSQGTITERISTTEIQDDAVTLAKMAGGTDGNMITYDASGNPAVVASGSSGQFLKSQGADTVPVFAAAAAGNKTLYIPAIPRQNSTYGGAPGGNMGGCNTEPNQTSYIDMCWTTPDDYTSVTSLNVHVVANGAGQFHLQFDSRALASGENAETQGSTDSISVAQYAFTSGDIQYVSDITACINGLSIAAGDIVDVRMKRDGTSGSDTGSSLVTIGFRLIYS